MTKEFENRGTKYSIHENVNIGEIRVADEVVAIIAGLAATEVDGVAGLAGNLTNDKISKLGMKSLSKGIKISVEDGAVEVSLILVIKYGCEIPTISVKVQERVKSAIETMTGLDVTAVNIKFSDVDIEG